MAAIPMIQEQPLVSIAMASFNGERYLEQQLESLVNQTYRNIEIIISDDHSTDNTEQLIRSFMVRDARIHFYHNEGTAGIKNNFENALRHCTGSLIALSDQDDTWMPEKIALLVENIGDNMLIYHNSLFVDDAGNSLGQTVADTFHCYSGDDPRVFLLENCVSGHAALFRATLLEHALPFPGSRYHDWWLAFVATSLGSIQYLPQVLVHYRQHASSKTDILKRRNDHKHAGAFNKYIQELEWYRRCAAIPSRHSPFLEAWETAYAANTTRLFNFPLLRLAYNNRDVLFTISKKDRQVHMMEMMRLVTGVPLKKLFV